MRNYKVYLAGPITGLSYDEATNWREEVKENLMGTGIQGYSPMRGKDFLSGGPKIKDHYDQVLASVKGINTRDYNDVITSDAIFVNFLGAEKVSIGTVMEIAWARAHSVPVVCVMEKDNIHHHSMLDYACGYIVESVEEGLNILKLLLLPDRSYNECKTYISH